MKEFMRKTGFLFLFSFVLLLAYALRLPDLSFYGDDWIYVYNYHIAGAESFNLFTSWDRPFSGWLYTLASALIKESCIGYHIFLFALQWLSVFCFWKVLGKAFGSSALISGAVLLFAVYPGFQQQPIAVEYIMHFTSLTLVLASISLSQSILASEAGLSGKNMILFFISLIFCAAAIFTCEYFVGLELTRPLFLYFTAKRNQKRQMPFKKFLAYILPYAVITGAFFVWRVFIFSFQTYQPKILNSILENPLNGIKTLLTKIMKDLGTVFFSAYQAVLKRPAYVSVITVLLILISVSVWAFVHLLRLEKCGGKPDDKTSRQMLLTGCVLTILSGIPFWATSIDVAVTFPWDRATLSFSPGAAMVIAAVFAFLFRSYAYCAASAVLTALCVVFQLNNAGVYIHEAEKMNDYFWQLAWRVPALEEGTIVISDEIPLDRYSDNDLSPVLNWQYAPESAGFAYKYKYFDLDLRESAYYADPNVTVEVDHTYRSHSFRSNTEKTLGVYYREHGCMLILDEDTRNYPGLPESIERTAVRSDTDLIRTDTQAVPPAAIGAEPEHGYCWYYQKIELALQQNDTDSAHRLAGEVISEHLSPYYAADWAPILAALAISGDVDSFAQAVEYLQASNAEKEYLRSFISAKCEDFGVRPNSFINMIK